MDRALLVRASDVIAAQVRNGLAAIDLSSIASEMRAWLHGSQNSNLHPESGAASNLYSGPLGGAIFLAAHARITGEESSRSSALSIARAITSSLALEAEESKSCRTPGGLAGLGGLIYGLCTVARLLDRSDLLDSARSLVGCLSAEIIADDGHFDVVFGSAGTMLCLLALPSPENAIDGGLSPLDLAELCAEHLVRQRRPVGPYKVISEDPGKAPLGGFAHGAAGIAVALARLHRFRPRPELRQVVFEALDFQHGLYKEEMDNWVPSTTDQETFSLGWCHGAPGIALAHLSIAADLAKAGEVADIDVLNRGRDAALEACARHRPTPLDHVCCGNMSRAETFLVAHGQNADQSQTGHLGNCHRFARWVLRSAKARGHFVVPKDETSQIAFFQGIAGVGYGFLRIAESEELPCVLLME